MKGGTAAFAFRSRARRRAALPFAASLRRRRSGWRKARGGVVRSGFF
jgi:hypothetical protein